MKEWNSSLSEVILGLFYVSLECHVCQPFIVLDRKYVIPTGSRVQAEKRLLNCSSADSEKFLNQGLTTKNCGTVFKWTLLFSALPSKVAQPCFEIQF